MVLRSFAPPNLKFWTPPPPSNMIWEIPLHHNLWHKKYKVAVWAAKITNWNSYFLNYTDVRCFFFFCLFGVFLFKIFTHSYGVDRPIFPLRSIYRFLDKPIDSQRSIRIKNIGMKNTYYSEGLLSINLWQLPRIHETYHKYTILTTIWNLKYSTGVMILAKLCFSVAFYLGVGIEQKT